MIFKNKYIALLTLSCTFFFSSCFNDLNTEPLDPDVVTSASVFDDQESYIKVLSKLYAGLAVTGQQGPAGLPDIQRIDEGFSAYIRLLWKMQELPTDEAVIAWGDQTIQDFHAFKWDASDVFINAMYSRIFFQIVQTNSFLVETSADKLDARGVDGDLRSKIPGYRAEARFLRALSYWHALDFYRNPPFVTEADGIGAFLPKQTSGPELYNYLESELLEIESILPAPNANEYGRADQGAVWMLLAKLYLNAEVYTGTANYAGAVTYSKKIIDANYALADDYIHNFLADNHTSPEIIFPVLFDGLRTQTYGGTTFLVHASTGGSMLASDYGIDSGWAGLRTTSALFNKFAADSLDVRATFHKAGQELEIASETQFTDGYAFAKYRNITRDGGLASDLEFTDIDFPMFRLADAYLIYAEGVLRNGGGDRATAVQLINNMRKRGYENYPAELLITDGDLNLDFILDERARELFAEGHRRTDLIRFGKFTSGDYVWPWKGDVAEGVAVDEKYNLYPISATDIIANPELTQNAGY